jgi:hypothetical protein
MVNKKHEQRVVDELLRLQKDGYSTRKASSYMLDVHWYTIGNTSVQAILSRVWKAIQEYSENTNTPIEKIRHIRHKDKLEDWSRVSAFIKNTQEDVSLRRLKDDIITMVKQYAPKYPKIKREKCKDWHLLVIDPADIHIGKLASAFETGEEYSNQTAVQRVLEWVQGILDKSSSYNIDQILFIWGNDILHIDSPKRQTTSWTPQDTDGMWYDNFMIAKQLYVDVLEMLISIADVHFVYNPSNHDYTNGFFLCQTIESFFHNNKNITFETNMSHRKYYQYGKNMIGTTHWDGAKAHDLPVLMATENPIMRSQTLHRYIYSHHVHHKISKDYIGATFETLRSPSGADSRHHRNWYQHAPKAVEGFLHHKDFGQIWRFTHNF